MKCKNKDLKIITLIAAILLFISIQTPEIYNDLVAHPFNSPSPGTSGKLFSLFLYKVDNAVGKVGVMTFFGFLVIWNFYIVIKCYSKK
jgi:hypothetical protein